MLIEPIRPGIADLVPLAAGLSRRHQGQKKIVLRTSSWLAATSGFRGILPQSLFFRLIAGLWRFVVHVGRFHSQKELIPLMVFARGTGATSRKGPVQHLNVRD
jgi:hypothetical protein